MASIVGGWAENFWLGFSILCAVFLLVGLWRLAVLIYREVKGLNLWDKE